jgi:hypothetical protein
MEKLAEVLVRLYATLSTGDKKQVAQARDELRQLVAKLSVRESPQESLASRTEEALGRLAAAVKNRDKRAGLIEVRQLRALGWTQEQIMFLLTLQRRGVRDNSMVDAERASRARAIIVSLLVALPTVIVSVGFKFLALREGYVVISELERWYGGIVIGALFSLTVGDYRVWLESALKNQRDRDRDHTIARAYLFWQANGQLRYLFLLKPRELYCQLSGQPRGASPPLDKNQRIQGFLVVKFAELGWGHFWNAVAFERNLGPSKFFALIALGCGLLAAAESITSGVLVGLTTYLQMTWLSPTIGVATIYLPSLIRGVDTAQSSNVAPAVRGIVTMLLFAACIVLDLCLQRLGLPKVGLINLLNLFR